jgi:signal transduction histidine kinase
MELILRSLAYLAAALLGGVAVVAGRDWTRSRDRTRGFLTLSLLFLTVFSASVSVAEAVGNPVLYDVAAVAVFGAAYALLLVRHTLLPVPRPALALAGLLCLAAPVVAIATGVSHRDPSALSTWEQAVYAAGTAAFAACVGEPVLRLWRTARGRPLIQGARLRFISLAYSSVILALAGPLLWPQSELAWSLGQLAVGLLLYVSFAPPRMLRRVWREREERELIKATLLFSIEDRSRLAEEAVDWAVRLIGADAGFVFDPARGLLASRGIRAERAEALADHLDPPTEPRIDRVDEGTLRRALSLPLRQETGLARLVVLAGPFTPPIEAEEIRLLRHFADGIATAMDRLQLDELRHAFLTAVSHELRTPLTSVIGISRLLESSGEDGLPAEDRADLTRRLVRNADRLDILLKDLLDLDRLGRGELTVRRRPTDLARLVRGVVDAAPYLERHPVEVDIPPLVADVEAGMIERIVENLLSNAAKYTPPGTLLWVRVAEHNGGLVIAVEDAGPGVEEPLRKAVFQPFRRGSEDGPGTGIGLTLVSRFAEAHGGRAWVQEREGGGASFRVYLPRRSSPPPPD